MRPRSRESCEKKAAKRVRGRLRGDNRERKREAWREASKIDRVRQRKKERGCKLKKSESERATHLMRKKNGDEK